MRGGRLERRAPQCAVKCADARRRPSTARPLTIASAGAPLAGRRAMIALSQRELLAAALTMVTSVGCGFAPVDDCGGAPCRVDTPPPVESSRVEDPLVEGDRIAAGGFHSCAVGRSGAVRCWGENSSGQLGDGTVRNRNRPVDVEGLSANVAAVTVGVHHSCALLKSGAVKCWGLGQGSHEGSRVPVDVAGLSSGVRSITAGVFDTCAVLHSRRAR